MGDLPFKEGNIAYPHIHTPAPHPGIISIGPENHSEMPGKNPSDRYQTVEEMLTV